MEKFKKILLKIKEGLKAFIKPLVISLILLLVCGLIFPLTMTGVSQLVLHDKANGSLIYVDGKPVGSKYVGQKFTEAYFLWGRPSAVDYNTCYLDKDGNLIDANGDPYKGPASGSENLAPSNPKLEERVKNDLEKFLEANPGVKKEEIPVDLLTASGSGLDPHISVSSAMIQVKRISKASGLTEDEVKKIIKDNTEGKFLLIFGEDKVNVLGVNLDIAEKMGKIS